jgi:hypothetical protein
MAINATIGVTFPTEDNRVVMIRKEPVTCNCVTIQLLENGCTQIFLSEGGWLSESDLKSVSRHVDEMRTAWKWVQGTIFE